jgi:hypothetical protein
MNQPYNKQHLLKLTCFALLALPILISACAAGHASNRAASSPNNTERKQVAGELIVDAIPGVEMYGHEMFADGMDRPFYSSAVTRKGNTAKMDFPLRRLPQQVRVIWRKKGVGTQILWGSEVYYDSYGKDISRPGFIPTPLNAADEIAKRKVISENTGVAHYGPWGSSYRDELAGDYTIPVASRIPASVFEEIERHGGALRIKFRLKPDGVMLGWDIQRKGFRPCTIFEYYNAGGDFREVELCNGKLVRKGWYIDKAGQKIETEY